VERIFREYAEERAWRKAAAAIEKARSRKPIESGRELSEILGRVLPKKGRKSKKPCLFTMSNHTTRKPICNNLH